MGESERSSAFKPEEISLRLLGIILLAVGISLIMLGMVFIKPETVPVKTVQITLMGNYEFIFHAEKNDWVEFDINSSRASFLYVYTYSHYGTRHEDSFQINETDDYRVTLANDVQFVRIPYESTTFSGNFSIQRPRAITPVLLFSGVAFVVSACIFLVIPIMSPLLLSEKSLALAGHLSTYLRSLPRALSFFMLLVGTFLMIGGVAKLSIVSADPFFDKGLGLNVTILGSALFAIGIVLEIIRKKYSEGSEKI